MMGLSLGGIVTTATVGRLVYELWSRSVGHVFDCDKATNAVDEVIAKSVQFIKEHC